MKKESLSRRPGARAGSVWQVAVAVVAVGVLISQLAIAAAPAAGTQIGNQATATYRDPDGVNQLATSNQVLTLVQQVGSYTLTADGTKSAGAGATVSVPHTLTNTGNGTDAFNITVAEAAGGNDFTKIEVYPDDGSGNPLGTTPLCTQATAGSNCVVPAQSVAAGAQYKFVVVYTVPATATGTPWNANTATVTAVPATPALYTTTTLSNTDTVNFTAAAAFTLTKGFTQPSAAAPATAPLNGTWPTPASSGPQGTRTLYTLTYSNTGGDAGTLYIKDQLPAGVSYVGGTAVWSAAAGVALNDSAGAETVSGIEYEHVGGLVRARIANVGAGSSGTLTFVVDVAPTAAVGTSQTTNTANFSPVSCAQATIAASETASCASASTTALSFTVTATRGVRMGPVLDTTAGTPANATDKVTVASGVAGQDVLFTHTVVNTGNAPDAFNLSVVNATAGAGGFPAGTTFTWYDASGTTPLGDSTADGKIDTGNIAAGATGTFVLRVSLPLGTQGAATAPYSATAVAESFADATKKDAVFSELTLIIGGLVDLTNTAAGVNTAGIADIGTGPSASPTVTASAVAGSSTATPISLFVRNNDVNANVYSLSASQNTTFPGTFPVGWTVTFNTANTCLPANAITQTGSITGGAQTEYFACVTVPASQTAATIPMYFQVRSTSPTSSGATAVDTIHDAITVTAPLTLSFTVTPSNTSQSVKGGTPVYTHTITNTGTQTCSALNAVAASSKGWSVVVYEDTNGNNVFDSGDLPVPAGGGLTVNAGAGAGALAAGTARVLFVKVVVPGGAALGDQDITTLTVTDTTAAPNNCVIAGANPTDTTTVFSGQVTIDKQQALDAACDGTADTAFSKANLNARPGQCVVYEVVATNTGTADVTNVSLNDALPPSTTFSPSQPSVRCEASASVTGTAVAVSNPTANSIACGSATNVMAASGKGVITLRFAVRIDQ